MKTDLVYRIQRTLSKADSFLSGVNLVRQISYIVDSTIVGLFFSLDLEEKIVNKICIIPVGGYGRTELAPYSDIDILYLHDGLKESTLQKIISYINNTLFDSKMTVGHSCRTIEESREYLNNLHSFHAILDSRFLVGSRKLYERYKKEFLMQIPKSLIEQFNQEKTQFLQERILHSHLPLNITEPNIKTDPLGLRDIQYVYWIQKTTSIHSNQLGFGVIDYFTNQNTMELILAYDFFLKVRVALHKLAGKKTDRLELSLQPDIASELNFGPKGIQSLEAFMSTFYKHQKNTQHSIGLFLDKIHLNKPKKNFKKLSFSNLKLIAIDGKLYPPEDIKLFTQPDSLYKDVMSVFLAAQKYDLEISPTLMNDLRFASSFLDDDFKNNREAISLFLEFLRNNKNIGKYLTYMHHCNVLGKFIPEFGACTNFPLFSYHHEYPVDEHSLLILRELDQLVNGTFEDKEVQKVFYECKNIPILYMALLIHDAGKVKEGDHCQYGAELSRAISDRWNLSEEESDLFWFLVNYHIDMSEISGKRDIFDPNLISKFAKIVGSIERLNLLYVLTMIDTKSVGPNILTEWKKDILYKLYISTKEYLLNHDKGIQTLTIKKEQFLNYLVEKENIPLDLAERILDFSLKMSPSSYMNSTTFRRILGHFKAFQELIQSKLNLKIEYELEPSFLTLSVYSQYRRDVLVHIAGNVSELGLNVVGMRNFHYKDDKDYLLLTEVYITDSNGSGVIPTHTINFLAKELLNSLNSNRKIEDWNIKSLVWLHKNPIPEGMVDEMVTISQPEGLDYTILEIRLPDSIGLLFRILKILYKKNIEILFARIVTSADFAYDTFYIKKLSPDGLLSKKEMEELANEIKLASKYEVSTMEEPVSIYF